MGSRRSRRSKVSKPGKRKGQSRGAVRWLIYGGLVAVFLVVGSMIYGYGAVRSYLRSDEFRVMLGSRAGEALEGKGDFSSFRWDGWSVSTEECSFVGAEGIREFQARGIEGEVDIGAIWGNAYRLENIQLREFIFQGDFREGVVGSGEIDHWESEPGFFSDFLPDRVEVTGVDVAAVSGEAWTDGGDWRWANTTARIRPGLGEQVYEVELNGGELRTPLALIDRLSLRSARGRYSGEQFFLLSSEFGVFNKATLRAEGDFHLATKAWQVRGDLVGARVEDLVEEDWKQKLMGPIMASFEVDGGADGTPEIRGDFKISDGVLTALPVLDHIAAYANSTRFRRLALSEAGLEFEKRGSVLNLRDILLASEGLVRIEGDMRIEGEVIRKGDFQVGITPGTLAHLPGAETKVFHRGRLGLLWAPLTVSGTLNAPREDLSGRLIAAARERMFERIPETGQYALKYGGSVMAEATKAILKENGIVLGAGKEIMEKVGEVEAKDILETGKEVLEKGKGVVGGGVGTIFDIFGRPVPKEE